MPIRVYNRMLQERSYVIHATEDKARRFESQLSKARGEHRAEVAALHQVIENTKQDPNRIDVQLKSWVYALNKFGIGVRIVAEWVTFRKNCVDVRMHWWDLLNLSIPTIIKILSPVEVSAIDPQNYVDGIEGWKHPDTERDEREVALQDANDLLKRAGLVITATKPLHGDNPEE